MDPILAPLSLSQLTFVEAQLSNDEASSDEEMRADFIRNGLTGEQAQRALAYRDLYLNNLYLAGFTPICEGTDALRFGPHRRLVEPN